MVHVRPRARRRIAALLPAVGVLLVAGCAQSAAPAVGSPAQSQPPSQSQSPLPRPVVGAIARLDSTVGRTLPIERYLYTTEQLAQVAAARYTLTERCMRRYGLTFTPAARPRSRPGGQATHRYDVVDPADGYRVPGSGRPTPSPSPTPRLSPEEITVLAGDVPGNSKPITTFHGLPVPHDGCLGEADGELTAQGGSVTDDQLAVNINFEDYQRSMTDPTLRAVFRRWSGCMKAGGHPYPTPMDAMGDKRWKGTPEPSPEEIATATADAACRRRTDVVGAWFTVESAYEAQAIRANLGALEKVRRGISAVLRNAAVVNGGGVLRP